MIEISLNNVKKTYGFKNVLNDISFEIKAGERVALIGDNGCGKSTILNIITGLEKPDSGALSIKKDSNIGYLMQQPELLYKDKNVKKILYESNDKLFKIYKRLKKYEEKMINNSADISLVNKFLNIQEEYINQGGYELNTLIEKVSHGLKINNLLDSTFDKLSGGEQKRVLLASLIMRNSNILILDEPTNHLDIETLEWLECFLNKYNGTIVIVSHDRYFLDKVSTKTILIENGKAITFYGNYSYYLKENDLRVEREFHEYKDQQKQIEAMKRKIKQLQEFGKLAYPGGEPFFKRAENIRKRLEKLELKNKPVIKQELPINLKSNDRSCNDVLRIIHYDLIIDSKILIKNIDINIYYKDRVCIIGENGCGKSTLIKQILKNNSANITIGPNVKIGYILQQISFDEDIRVLEYARKFFIGDESQLRSVLSKFYFYGEFVYKKINKLSGGEKVRLKLFELIYNKSNFIILDEPTNHLDIYTKETLENALKEFDGTILFVSHDRYFINKLATKILYITNKNIFEYFGNFDYFIEHKL